MRNIADGIFCDCHEIEIIKTFSIIRNEYREASERCNEWMLHVSSLIFAGASEPCMLAKRGISELTVYRVNA
jgi:hypothetical protein